MSNSSNGLVKAYVTGGQYGKIAVLDRFEAPNDELADRCDREDTNGNWTFHKNFVVDSTGTSFCGFAAWGPWYDVQVRDRHYRLRLLFLDRFGIRTMYAVPARLVDNEQLNLPDLDLSTSEAKLLAAMAKAFKQKKSRKEYHLSVKHPSRDTLLECPIPRTPFNESALLSCFQTHPELLGIFAAFQDAQMRAQKLCSAAPSCLYNLTKAVGADGFEQVFNCLTLINEPGAFGAGPIDLVLAQGDTLADFSSCFQRLVLIHPTVQSQIYPLLEWVSDTERQCRCGGQRMQPFSSIPLIVSRSTLLSDFAVNIALPDEIASLSLTELSTLRSAMGSVLTKDTTRQIFDHWKALCTRLDAYRYNWGQLWQISILEIDTKVLFKNKANQDLVQDMVVTYLTAEQQKAEEAKATVSRIVQRLATPGMFADKIVDKPATLSDLDRLLGTGIYAFWYTPTSGKNIGKRVLAFTRDSLQRFAADNGCSPDLFDAVLNALDREGLLDSKDRTIRFGKEKLSTYTLRVSSAAAPVSAGQRVSEEVKEKC